MSVKRVIADHDYVCDYLPSRDATLNRDYEDLYVLASDYDAVCAERDVTRHQFHDLRQDFAAVSRERNALAAQVEMLEKRLAELTTTLQLIGTAAVEAVKVKP